MQNSLYCIGSNIHGECNSPPSTQNLYNPDTLIKQYNDEFNPLIIISAGENHSCAMLIAYTNVICWGSNSHGQGTPSVLHLMPVVYMLYSGYEHNCVLTMLGLECWGNNDSGQSKGLR